MTPGSLSPNTCGQGSPPNRMKVTMVTPYWAPVRGGTTTYVRELAAELLRTYGLDVTVIAREGRGEARVTVVSAAIPGTTIRAFGFRTRTRVTHPGVSLAPASAQSVAVSLNTSRLAVRRPIVGYLGRLVWDEKVRGVAHLIRAMKMVRMSFPSATLVIAGEGPHRTALEELAAREAAGCVVFLGDL